MKFLERALDHQNQWWKYLVIFVVAFIGSQILGIIPMLAANAYKIATSDAGLPFFPDVFAPPTLLGYSKNVELMLTLFPFVVWLLLTYILIKALHKRSFSETINGRKKIRFGRVRTGFTVWFVLMSVFYFAYYLVNPDNFILQFDLGNFVVLSLVVIVFITIQAGTEEFIIRGYLTQGVASWTRSRLLAVILPGLLFALLHIFNPEVGEHGFGAIMPMYLLVGIIFGLTSVLDDGIELAIGAHVANNIFLVLFVTNSSSVIQSYAVFEMLSPNPVVGFLSLLAMGIIFVVYFVYRYKWDFKILTKRVEKPKTD